MAKYGKVKGISQEKMVEQIVMAMPDGWTNEVVPGMSVYGQEAWERSVDKETTSVVLKTEGIVLIFRCGSWTGRVSLDGTTLFKGVRCWQTFDRRGVESSFHWDPDWADGPFDAGKIIQTELDNIKAAIERSKTAIPIPGKPLGGWTLQPQTLEKYKKKLKAGLSVSFYPSGFGTGYLVSTRPNKDRYAGGICSRETAQFFEVPVLYYETTDCD